MSELKCGICGCPESQTCKFYKHSRYGDYLCNRHYMQLRKRGKILTKTRLDPLEIEIKKDYAEIILKNTYAEEVARAKIDIDDIEKVKKYKWYKNAHDYVESKQGKKRILLHELVFGKKEGYIIDHINRNKLDNRKINLRYATISQNGMNKKIQSNNTSGYTGVYWDKSRDKWIASIQINSKQIYLGRYDDINDAIKARKDAEIKYFGKYARDYYKRGKII